jgi:hypothetical protein
MQAQRLKISFDTDEKAEMELQNQIFDKTRQVTSLLKASELDLRRLANSDGESKSDEQIMKNILATLASKL